MPYGLVFFVLPFAGNGLYYSDLFGPLSGVLALFANAVPVLLYPLVVWYYPRVLGRVHYSVAQKKAFTRLMWRLLLWTIPAMLVEVYLLAPFSLVLLAFAAALLHQWKDEGSRVALLHYPLAAAVAIVTGLLPLVPHNLPISISDLSGYPSLDSGLLGACIVVIGLCDHFVLMRNLKKLPKEST